MDSSQLRTHLETLARRDQAAEDELIKRLTAACWPGGCADHIDPVALHWVRRWRPRAVRSVTPVCGCLFGRCTVCN